MIRPLSLLAAFFTGMVVALLYLDRILGGRGPVFDPFALPFGDR